MAQRVSALKPSEYKFAPLEGFVCMNVDLTTELYPQKLLDIKSTSYAGQASFIANLMSAPSYTTSTETVNPFEDAYGRRGSILGELQIQSITDEVTIAPFSLTLDVMQLLMPDATFTQHMSQDATPVAVGVKIQRTGDIQVSDYVSNIVLALSGSEQAVARAVVLENVINVNDEISYELSDDFAVFGVECTLRAHSTDAQVDPVTGNVLPAAWQVDFQNTTVPA